MSIVKEFNKQFGIPSNSEDEQKRFVNRINQLLFNIIDTEEYVKFRYGELFDVLCVQLGENATDLRRIHGRKPEVNLLSTEEAEDLAPEIRILTQSDFTRTLLVLCVLYSIFKANKIKVGIDYIEGGISRALANATSDLGVRWKEGLFYPSGTEELDKTLIEDTLVWLDKYPNEKKDYKRALECYQEGTHLGDTVKNCYIALEGISRVILKNGKTLDNNKDALLAHMGLSDGWKSILGAYINYAHDFRHASEERHTASKAETEAFLYMTGLVMRLLIEKQ